MHEEVKLGASYIVRLLNRHQKLDCTQVETFIQTLTTILCDKFEGHWYPESPQKGQAYRCIRIEQSQCVDDSVLQACMRSGLRCSQLALPRDMYLWIDPQEVSCRLGESCSPFTVKAPEEKEIQNTHILDKSELETSDYHSDGSDTTGTPSESSSEDEETGGSKEMKTSPVIPAKKLDYYPFKDKRGVQGIASQCVELLSDPYRGHSILLQPISSLHHFLPVSQECIEFHPSISTHDPVLLDSKNPKVLSPKQIQRKSPEIEIYQNFTTSCILKSCLSMVAPCLVGYLDLSL